MIEAIKKLVESETGLNNIETRLRNQQYVDARVIYTTLALTHTKLSYTRIAKLIDRDHSSIVHHQKIYRQWLREPERYSYNIKAYERIDCIIERGREDIEHDTDLIVMFKEKNENLLLQIQELHLTIERQKERIEQLKKYEPIW